jgi:hypothetical protein
MTKTCGFSQATLYALDGRAPARRRLALVVARADSGPLRRLTHSLADAPALTCEPAAEAA